MKYKIVKEFVGDINDFARITREHYPILFETHVILKNLSWSEAQKFYNHLKPHYCESGKFSHHRIYIINESELSHLPERLTSDEFYCDVMNN